MKVHNKEKQKRWVCPFSCLTTRAVLLQVTQDLYTKEFLNAFRRFCARRGTPKKLLSDSTTQLVKASKSLQINWKFITPNAPWKGGVYERLIGLFKRALKTAIGKKLLTSSEFNNIVTEIEGIRNTRPITRISNSSMQALRPADFLIPGTRGATTDENETSNSISRKEFKETSPELIARLKGSEECLKLFWHTWRRDYLQYLRKR